MIGYNGRRKVGRMGDRWLGRRELCRCYRMELVRDRGHLELGRDRELVRDRGHLELGRDRGHLELGRVGWSHLGLGRVG